MWAFENTPQQRVRLDWTITDYIIATEYSIWKSSLREITNSGNHITHDIIRPEPRTRCTGSITLSRWQLANTTGLVAGKKKKKSLLTLCFKLSMIQLVHSESEFHENIKQEISCFHILSQCQNEHYICNKSVAWLMGGLVTSGVVEGGVGREEWIASCGKNW